MTPFYERDGITIFCGECSQVMSQWEADSIDLTVTSPPYDNLRTYNGYTFDFEAIAGQLWRVTAKGGVVVWVVGDATIDGSETGTSFRQALGFMGLGFNLHDTMIYSANKPPLSHNRYEQMFEYMFVFSKGKPDKFNPIMQTKNDRTLEDKRDKKNYRREKSGIFDYGFINHKNKNTRIKGNLWHYNVGYTSKGTNIDHPAPFPEALARDHIISWSNPGDLVCDPMLGSGTAAKMAQHLGRRFVGCEISEEYCKIAVDRLRQPSFFSIPTQPAKVEAEQAAMSL